MARALDGYRCANCNEVTRFVVLPSAEDESNIPYRTRDNYINKRLVKCEVRFRNKCRPPMMSEEFDMEAGSMYNAESQFLAAMTGCSVDLRCQDLLTKTASCTPCLMFVCQGFLDKAKDKIKEAPPGEYVVEPVELRDLMESSREERLKEHREVHKKRPRLFKIPRVRAKRPKVPTEQQANPGESKVEVPAENENAEKKRETTGGPEEPSPVEPLQEPMETNGSENKETFQCERCGKRVATSGGLKNHLNHCKKLKLITTLPAAKEDSHKGNGTGLEEKNINGYPLPPLFANF